MFDEVLTALIGRIPERTLAVATGWRVVALPERVYPGLVQVDDAEASGVVIHGLTTGEWTLLDAFEDNLYQLVRLDLVGGQDGWTYCGSPGGAQTTWESERFRRRDLAAYTDRCRAWRAAYQPRPDAVRRR